MKSSRLSNFCLASLLCYLTLRCGSCSGFSFRDGENFQSTRIRILEFDSASGKLVQVLTSRNSDIIFGEDVGFANTIVLECRSGYGPVTFTYRGDGAPEYVMNTNTTRTTQGHNFWTFLSFTRLPQAEYSGNYTCMPINNPTDQNSVYLYVPDSTNAVFVPSRLANRLEFPQSDHFRIPCSVVHPRASVSLQRISEGFQHDVTGQVTYNPKSGFFVPISMIDPRYSSTTFLCKGSFRGRNEQSEYKIFSEVPSSEFEPMRTPTRPETPKSFGSAGSGLRSACTKSTCGRFAECIVIEYEAHCVCLENYSGDPKRGCQRMSDHSQQYSVQDPCLGNPCGKNSNCLAVNRHPVCTCIENYYGTPPNCRRQKLSECTNNNDCAWEEHCNERSRTCESVCNGSIRFCGENSRCFSVSHSPFCECLEGYKGSPYLIKGNRGCQRQITNEKPDCSQLCGTNSLCTTDPRHPRPTCICPEGFTGNPKSICHKIKISESATDRERRLCNRTSCGVGAKCRLRNDSVECFCPSGFGDPNSRCTTIPKNTELDNIKVCNACGPNSVCTITNGKIACKCAPTATGIPPNCSHNRINSCRDNLDCPQNKVCDKGKCRGCSWMCSETAICEIIQHSVKCQCPHGTGGDPHFECKKIDTDLDSDQHPCKINCGPNTVCRAVKYDELQKYRESLRQHRQEGLYFDMIKANANIERGKYSECVCRKGYHGNAYSVSGCSPTTEDDSEFPVTIVMDPDPCKPSLCGQNSNCRNYNGRAFCSCDFNSAGRPPNCKLRCEADKHCLFNEYCVKGLCIQ